MTTKFWEPNIDTALLDERMDKAMKRASGSIGADIAFDKGRMRMVKDTAIDALDAGLSSTGPLFMRVGQGLFEAGSFKMGKSISLQEIGSIILYEFHTEAVIAFQTARTALHTEALAYMQDRGMTEEHCKAILDAANEIFIMPSKDAFTEVGRPLVNIAAMPLAQALLAGLIGGAAAVALTRVPHLGVIGGAFIGGAMYCFARSRIRRRAEELAYLLPRRLYEMLRTDWNSNIRRYAETVNAGIPIT